MHKIVNLTKTYSKKKKKELKKDQVKILNIIFFSLIHCNNATEDN